MNTGAIQAGVCLAVMAGLFLAGYIEGRDAANRENERAIAAANARARAEIEEREKANAENTSKMLQRLQDLQTRHARLSSTANRLSARLRAAGRATEDSGSGSACGVRLARCSELLAEGIDLGAEGAELAERIAIRKDAVTKLK